MAQAATAVNGGSQATLIPRRKVVAGSLAGAVSIVAGGTARLKTLRIAGDPLALAKAVETLYL